MESSVYSIDSIRQKISWSYFDWAWGVAGKNGEEIDSLHRDANRMLDSWEGLYQTRSLLLRLPANADGDDILVGETLQMRLPMLRQQEPPFRSLADYVRPLSHGIRDEIGVFCTKMDADIENRYKNDPYERMLSQTLADRLAEATAEKISEQMPGIRPAVGYPVMPDMSMNFLLDDLLDMKQIGITLTESGMMRPHASVSGLIFQHPKAEYFNIRKIGPDQLADYVRRRGMTVEEISKFIKI